MRRIGFVCVLLWLAFVLYGCSTIDGDDRAELENKLRNNTALPSLIEKMISDKQTRYLTTRPGNDRVATLHCYNSDGGYDSDIQVGDVIGKMISEGMPFDEALWVLINERRTGEMLAGADCNENVAYDPRYVGDTAPEELRDVDRSKVELKDVVDWIVGLPVPPPGIVWGGAAGELLPILCGLSVGWGCPDSPQYPGGTPSQPAPDHPGPL